MTPPDLQINNEMTTLHDKATQQRGHNDTINLHLTGKTPTYRPLTPNLVPIRATSRSGSTFQTPHPTEPDIYLVLGNGIHIRIRPKPVDIHTQMRAITMLHKAKVLIGVHCKLPLTT